MITVRIVCWFRPCPRRFAGQDQLLKQTDCVVSPRHTSRLATGWVLLAFIIALAFEGQIVASDHADPMSGKKPNANLTGLFAFPKDDNLIVVLNVIAGLTEAPPYDLQPHTFSILMSLTSKIDYDDTANLARYGGTIVNPEKIKPDVTIELKLNNDATLKEKSFEGLAEDGIELWTGVRDDPFIFPRFFGTNVVAVVLSIPMSSFPPGQQDWLIWGTSKRGSKQYDHVGRSLRTMLPRFEFLNTLPPHEHVAAIRQRHDSPGLIDDIARTEIEPLFALRPYDFVPDVMIFTTRTPAGFPNGRRLTDDVAALICEQGDCLLYELSYGISKDYPRKTTNDKPFLKDFPFLAKPWPNREPTPPASLTTAHSVILRLLIVFAVGLILLPWVLVVIYRRRLKKLMPATSQSDATESPED
jgi:hypothetical protein